MPVLIVFIAIVTVGLFLLLFFYIRGKRHTSFVVENSNSLKALKALNGKYIFFDILNYTESHTYDNDKFYDNISCEDYLIYQLQFNQNRVKQEISKADSNKSNFARYCTELSKIDCFGDFDKSTDKYNKKLLRSIETRIFTQNTKSPVIEFKAKVLLYCAQINGRVYTHKQATFTSEQIKNFIRRLNNRKGAFYNDRGIWDSICRVERGKVSNKMRFSIYKRDDYRCRICGRTSRFNDLEIDHIKPIAKGGKSTYDNLQTLCRRCNTEKGDTY